MNMWFCCSEYEMIVEIGFFFAKRHSVNLQATDKRIVNDRNFCVYSSVSFSLCVTVFGSHCKCAKMRKQVATGIIRSSSITMRTRELISNTLWLCVHYSQSWLLLFFFPQNIRPFDSFDCKIHSRFKILWCSLFSRLWIFFFSCWFFEKITDMRNKTIILLPKIKRLGLFSFCRK